MVLVGRLRNTRTTACRNWPASGAFALVTVVAQLQCSPVHAECNTRLAIAATASYKVGRYAEAADLFLHVFKSCPNQPVALYNAAGCEEKAGKRAAARSHFEEFLRVACNRRTSRQCEVARTKLRTLTRVQGDSAPPTRAGAGSELSSGKHRHDPADPAEDRRRRIYQEAARRRRLGPKEPQPKAGMYFVPDAPPIVGLRGHVANRNGSVSPTRSTPRARAEPAASKLPPKSSGPRGPRKVRALEDRRRRIYEAARRRKWLEARPRSEPASGPPPKGPQRAPNSRSR